MHIIAPTDSFTRPGNTTQYAANDLVANDTTAGSVTPLKFSLNGIGRTGMIRRARISKTTNTATAASFNIHLFDASPTVTNGDNGAFAVASNINNWLGKIAVDMSSGALAGASTVITQVSVAAAIGVNKPTAGAEIYALIEALGAYAPGSEEVFTVRLEIEG